MPLISQSARVLPSHRVVAADRLTPTFGKSPGRKIKRSLHSAPHLIPGFIHGIVSPKTL